MAAITRLGCIVCINEGWGATPAAVHHLLEGGRRISHLHTIPLCPSHHNAGVNNHSCVSRHPHKRAFERRYGPETRLLEQVRFMVKGEK